MAKFFSAENRIWKPFSYIADVVLMSGLFLLCSLPVVSLGAAVCGLYDCAARCIRGKDPAMFSRFFRTGKREFLPSLLSSLLWAAIIGASFALVRLLANSLPQTPVSTVVTVAMLAIVVMILGTGCWALPLLSRFTFTFGALQATAVKLALSHPIRTALLGASAAASAWLSLRFVIPVFVTPALTLLFWTWLLEPVFKPFMESPEEAEPADPDTI